MGDDNPVSGIWFLLGFWFSFCLILTNWYVVILEEGFREAKLNVKHIFDNQDCILNLSRRQILTFMSHFKNDHEDAVEINQNATNNKVNKPNKNVNAVKPKVYVRKFR